jgi:di/tricarboxylate transporter
VKYVLRSPKSLLVGQIRLLIPVAILSAFINNTPIVAMMIPVVQNWGRQCGLSVSQLMMPLSYAAILGGVCTIIGTSTNLVVQGLAEGEDPTLQLGFFEIAKAGLPLLAISLVYIMMFSRCLLPTTHPDDLITGIPSPSDDEAKFPSHLRLYTTELLITKVRYIFLFSEVIFIFHSQYTHIHISLDF